MKRMILLSVISFFIFKSYSQSVLSYEFLGNLNEKNGLGPALTVLGNEGSYVTDTLNEISGKTKTVYRFEQNSGLQFNNAASGNFIGDTYSIEIYFVFDELNSWKRVVDWKNRTTDYGAYVYYGQLNFYPYVYSNTAPVAAGEYTYYVITRDGATGKVLLYTDASVEINLDDVSGDALLSEDNVLNFFQDDLAVPYEASSGAVAVINLYNYVLDSNQVKQNFENIGSQVFAVNELHKSNVPMQITPNPASEFATIDLSGFGDLKVDLRIFNASGLEVYKATTDPVCSLIVNTSTFPEGIYVAKAESGNHVSSQKLIIMR
jgi:hypothetical protein